MPAARRTARPASPAFGVPGTRAALLLAAAVAIATLVAFSPVARNGFVNYDDGDMLTENPNVAAGLTASSVRWAFTSVEHAYWVPLTWLSHQVDFQLFGMNAGAHHAVSALMHAANAALLLVLLNAMTGAPVRSALVSALFALHPLRVESVAWASSRRDVLSLFLCLLACAAWLSYARSRSRGAYAAALVLFAGALMSKPTIVTLPALLLLLDLWPLGRWPMRGRLPALPPAGILLEKVPLVLLAAGAGAVLFVSQRAAGAVTYAVTRDGAIHVWNACRSYGVYVLKTLWPSKLAVFYPYDWSAIPWWQPALGALLVAAVTALTLAALRRRPALFVGWAWYLGTLLPMIGLVQAGGQAMADRYTYLPHIGLCVLAVWAVADAAGRSTRARTAAAAVAALALPALAAATWVQTTHWRTSETLFRHALAVTEGNWLAHNNLGVAWGTLGDEGKALEHFTEALRIRPGYPMAEENLRRLREAQALRAAPPAAE